MLTGILRFELRYQTRQAAFFVAAAAFLLMGLVLVATGYGPENVHINSPYVVMQSMGLLSLLSIFVLTLFCAHSVLRDTEHKMAELIYATSVTRFDYLFGRFAGSLLAAFSVFCVAAAGLMLGPLVLEVDPERLGGIDVLRYLWALAVLVFPNMLFAASLLFAIAALSRNMLASYVGGVFVYAVYIVGSMWGDSPLMAGSAPTTPEALARAALLDPFGLSAFFEQTRYWTEHERNTRFLALEGHFLLNRLLWIGVSVGVLGLVYKLFAFRVPSGTKLGREAASERPVASASYRPVAVQARSGFMEWAALVSATKLECRHALKSGSFLALMAMWIFLVGMEIGSGASLEEYGTRSYPTTGLLLGAIQVPLSLIGTITLIYYSAELVWRARAARMDELLDVTPASSAVFYLSKAAALFVLIGVLTGSAVGVAMLYQLVRGWHHLEPGLYLSLFYFTGLPLALFAVAALFVQTLSPNRYVGMILNLLVAIVLHRGAAVGLEHNLLRYAGAPAVSYSDMNGFGLAAGSFSGFMVYWGAFAGLLAFVTHGVWRRGSSPSLPRRLTLLPRQWGRSSRIGVAACLGVFVGMGGVLFYNTNLLNEYETAEQLADWKVAYEKAYKQYEGMASPSVVAVRADVELHPEERRYRVAGTYRLENKTREPIETVWIAVRRDVTRAELRLAGAKRITHDARFGMSGFRLDRPMPPGTGAELSFDLTVERRGLRTSDFDPSIVTNGSFITWLEAFPSIGYRRSYELGDASERRKRGLPAATTHAPLDELDPSRGGDRRQAWTTFDTTVSTSADQIAVAPGVLKKEWRENGRRYFHYVVDRPMSPRFAYVSARYAVERVRHGGVDVEVYYHPAHAANVARILEATTRSLDSFGARFGPYPHEQLRIVEVPSYWDFGALALPNTIYVVEDRGFLTDQRDPEDLDLVTRRIAHEVAHQWWGHQLDPADQEGATTLNETLAKYSEQMILNATYGEASIPRQLGFERDRYLSGRAGEEAEEPPLYKVTDQAHLYYAKGAMVMNALRDLLGEAAVNRALSRLLREKTWPNGPPTTLDLLAVLHAEAPEQHRELIDQWLKEVVLYDLKVEAASYEPLPDGRYRVTARLAAGKTARRGGADVALSMDEQLDVAVFSGHPDEVSGDEHVLYAAKHRFDGASTEVSIVVDERPAYVGVDPFLRRIERERTDNIRKLEEAR